MVVEATGNAAAVVRLLAPYVGRAVVANPRRLSGVVGPRAKTDRLDARALARLLAAGMIEEVWTPTDELRALRRLLARRAALVRARTRAKNEVHAALLRNLHPRPPVKDLFGRAGRRWLAGLAFPADEQVTVEGCLRQVDALDEEIERLERLLAEQAIRSTEIRRLLTVPGVNLITAATFVAWVGDVRRFPSSRKLVAISASTHVSVSRVTSPPATGASPSRAQATSVMCSAKPSGRSSSPPGRCVPSSSACAPAAAPRSLRPRPPGS